jgi:hypothetical protein
MLPSALNWSEPTSPRAPGNWRAAFDEVLASVRFR